MVTLSGREIEALLAAMVTAWCEGQCDLSEDEFEALHSKLENATGEEES